MNVKDNIVSVNGLSITLFARQKPAQSKRNIFNIKKQFSLAEKFCQMKQIEV